MLKILPNVFLSFCTTSGDEDCERDMDVRDRALFFYRLLQNDLQKVKWKKHSEINKSYRSFLVIAYQIIPSMGNRLQLNIFSSFQIKRKKNKKIVSVL